MAEVLPVPSQAIHTRWSETPIEQLNPQLTRQFITGTQAMLARIDLKKGASVPRHSHPNEQISWITEGALLFTLGEGDTEQRVTVCAGEILVIPGNLPHAAEALEDTIDFDIFAPPRQDWIDKDDAYLRK
ncbi:MAG: cupin domain-containing protein [Janthinobacterium lividum]